MFGGKERLRNSIGNPKCAGVIPLTLLSNIPIFSGRVHRQRNGLGFKFAEHLSAFHFLHLLPLDSLSCTHRGWQGSEVAMCTEEPRREKEVNIETQRHELCGRRVRSQGNFLKTHFRGNRKKRNANHCPENNYPEGLSTQFPMTNSEGSKQSIRWFKFQRQF